MQKILFDKEIVNNQLSVLNNTLASQRQAKKTLLSHLEKFSDAIYENFNSESTDSLLSLINEAHLIFECIKSNINKILELKSFLENIYNSTFLNTINSEKFNNDFSSLLEDISKTNSSYLAFMNNYESFIKSPSIDENMSIDNVNEQEKNNSSTNIDHTDIVEQEKNNKLSNQANKSIHSENTTESIIIEEPQKDIKEEKIEKPKRKYKDFTIIDTPDEDSTEESKKSSPDSLNRELIINKSLGIAILPYSAADLDEVFLDNPEQYSSIEDIINQIYTVDLKDFENTSFSRYKEAFKLAKEKSNYTFSQATNFAKRFLVESDVTTIIIAACQNVEELEFYIECLNNNKPHDFHFFKIIEK